MHCFTFPSLILGRSRGSSKQFSLSKRGRYNQYRKSYDPYDSHDENEDECPHCDKYIGSPSNDRHSDCCPRYVDASLAVEKFASDDDDEHLEASSNITLPKQRQIQPFGFSGRIMQSDDLYLEQYEASREETGYEGVLADKNSELSHDQSTSKRGLSGPTRAQSMRGM